MSQELFNTLQDAARQNFENSIAVLLGNALLGAGYVLYWHKTNGLQTVDGWYPGYRTNQASYLQDATVQARLATAVGLVTIVDRPSALPRAATRPTTGGTVGPQDEVPVPAVSIEVGEVINGEAFELGTTRRWRSRILTITVLCRTPDEQAAVSDLLTATFDDDSTIAVLDHVGQSLESLGSADVVRVSITESTNPSGALAETYELILQAQLQFAA